MLKVHELMHADVVSISPDQTLREAIDLLVAEGIGGVPVLEGRRVVGVISARAIIEFESVTSAKRDPEFGSQDEAEEWVDEGGEPIESGYFTGWWPTDGPDLVTRISAGEDDQWDFLGNHTVAEAMSRTICTVGASMDVSRAAQHMLASGAQRALVLEKGKLVGILTATDILRGVAEQKIVVRQFVFKDG
jgi:CBS domain-containing protein